MTPSRGDIVQRKGEERSCDPKGRVIIVLKTGIAVSFNGLEPIWCESSKLVKVEG